MACMSTGQLASMCHRMGTSLAAGTDVLKVLNQESRYGSSAYQRCMVEVARRVGNGATLAEAFQASGGYLPDLLCELVGVGEQTGRLDGVFQRLSEHYQHLLHLRRTFLAGIVWPVFELGLGVVVIGGLIYLLGAIDPSSKGVFGLAGGRGLMIYLVIITAILLVGFVVVHGLRRGWFGSWPQTLMFRLPVIGTSLQTMAISRMAWTLSLALNAGIDARRAMRLAFSSTQSQFYTRHLDAVDTVIVRGGQFHEALRATGAFPSEFLNAMESAEVSGTESESLAHLSEQYQERAESSTGMLAVAAGVLVFVAIGAVFIFVIFSLFVTLYLGPINEAVDFANHPN